MKLFNKTELLVVAKAERESQNGNKYYKLVCLQNGEVFEANVSADIYNAVKEQTPYVFITEYASGRSQNGEYQYFRITGIASGKAN